MDTVMSNNATVFYYLFISLAIGLNLLYPVSAASSDSDDKLEILSIDKLKKLSLIELMQVTAIPEVSIATGKKQSAARAPAIVSVITAEDIEKTAATDIDDVLETVPGCMLRGIRQVFTIQFIVWAEFIRFIIQKR